jgi:hypothetical protein
VTNPLAPNPEKALRAWLRGQSELVAALTAWGSTSNEIDLAPDELLPCVVVYRAGGRPDVYVPTDVVVFGLDVLGKSTGSRQSAMDVQDALSGVLWKLENALLSPGVRATGCTLEQTGVWSPYSDGRARYVNTALVPIRRTALAA